MKTEEDKMKIAQDHAKAREKEIYNEAIEAAAGIAERSETNITQLIAEDIRGLKK